VTLNLNRSKWARVKFGDVVNNVNENLKDVAASGIERVIGLEHLDPRELAIGRWGCTSDENTFTRRVRPGQTLFGKRRSYQRKTAYAEFDAVCSGDILVFAPKDDLALLPTLLPFITSTDSFCEMALKTSAGSLSPRTRWSDIAQYEFSLPPLDEQKQIAECLWTAESYVRHQRSRNLALDSVLRSFRDGWFAHLSSPTTPFAELCSIASQNGMSKPKTTRAGVTPMVNMGEMFKGELLGTGPFERVTMSEAEIERFGLAEGDLLFARRSIVFEGAGLACLVSRLSEAHTFESSIIRVQPNAERALPEFLLHFFRSSRGRTEISKIVRRGPVSGITGSDLRLVPIPVPTLEEQQEMVDRAAQIISSRDACVAELDSTVPLRRALLEATLGGSE
jgi:type I restriction enzyme S subunit